MRAKAGWLNFDHEDTAAKAIGFNCSNLDLGQPRFDAGQQVIAETSFEVCYAGQRANCLRQRRIVFLIHTEDELPTLRIGERDHFFKQFVTAVFTERLTGPPCVTCKNDAFRRLFTLTLFVHRDIDLELEPNPFGIASNHRIKVCVRNQSDRH